MQIKRKKIYGWIKVIIIFYCAIGIALYYLQGKFLFHPQKLPSDFKFQFDLPFEEIFIPVNQEDTISMIKFFPKNSMRKGIVVYYHGNMGNISRYAGFASNFTRHGYEVWMPDYPGYGKSTGKRTEKKLYEQALHVQRMAATKYPADSIIIYGKSLGTGIATYVASVSSCKKLILETPYYSIPDLFHSYSLIYPAIIMSEYKIPTWKFIQDVAEPVTIFHGTDDEVIFYRNAAKLKQYLKREDKFITIQKGRHNDLDSFQVYKRALDSLLKN